MFWNKKNKNTKIDFFSISTPPEVDMKEISKLLKRKAVDEIVKMLQEMIQERLIALAGGSLDKFTEMNMTPEDKVKELRGQIKAVMAVRSVFINMGVLIK